MTTLRGFHHVALTMSDRDASAEWYGKVLGMGELYREEAEGRRACVMCFPGGAYSVGLVEFVPCSGSGPEAVHQFAAAARTNASTSCAVRAGRLGSVASERMMIVCESVVMASVSSHVSWGHM